MGSEYMDFKFIDPKDSLRFLDCCVEGVSEGVAWMLLKIFCTS